MNDSDQGHTQNLVVIALVLVALAVISIGAMFAP